MKYISRSLTDKEERELKNKLKEYSYISIYSVKENPMLQP